MPEFASWLRANTNTDPDIAALQAFANPRPDWPWWTDRLGDYVAVIQAANPVNKDALITSLGDNYGRWQADRAQPAESWLGWLTSHLGTVFLGLFGVVVAVAIVYGLFINHDFLKLMANNSQARGLITFLFALSTIAIILLVAVATFWMPKEDVETRFEKAKDLLTIIIGVLGTILGFYFGSLATPDGQATPPPPTGQTTSAGEAAR
jgi:hypothetical protein